MKIYLPPPLLVPLLVFAPLGARAAAAGAQAPARMVAPSSNVVGAHAPRTRAKRVAPLRASDTPAGTRVSVASDLSLADYSAYRRGDEFHVLIPRAEAEDTRPVVRGRGLSAARVEQVGGDLLLTFRLETNTAVQVKQNFNRLEILFAISERHAANAASPGANTQAPDTPAAPAGDSPPKLRAPAEADAGQADERLRLVLKRVEELEARVRELEAKQTGAAERRAPRSRAPRPSSSATTNTARADTRRGLWAARHACKFRATPT